jgi:hypothetical protein
MPKQTTQDDCRRSFADMAKTVITGIDRIDHATPAQPVEEPDWWVEMIDIQRKLIAWRERHANL